MPDDIQPQIQNADAASVTTPPPPVTDVNPNKFDDAKSVIDILFLDNVISQKQYDEIKVKSALDGVSREKVLNEMQIVSEDDISKARAKLLGIPFISLATTSFSPQALSFLPQARMTI